MLFRSPDALGMLSLKTSSPFIKVFSTTVSVSSKENTVLTAAVYTLHPSDIYNPARLSFLVVLACMLSVFAVLIYLLVFGQSAECKGRRQMLSGAGASAAARKRHAPDSGTADHRSATCSSALPASGQDSYCLLNII